MTTPPPAPNGDAVLEVKNLKTYFTLDFGVVKAVNGVSFKLGRQSTLGIVGESGCGKSITAMSIMPADQITSW